MSFIFRMASRLYPLRGIFHKAIGYKRKEFGLLCPRLGYDMVGF